jgi:hypothetical protein
MTGKELKEFAAIVPDRAIIKTRERGFGTFGGIVELQAVLVFNPETEKKAHACAYDNEAT